MVAPGRQSIVDNDHNSAFDPRGRPLATKELFPPASLDHFLGGDRRQVVLAYTGLVREGTVQVATAEVIQ
jgi:hypothetical protein